MAEHDLSTFRALLKELLRDPATKRLIEQRSGIAPRTLARWASGETEVPDRKRLYSLLDALPMHQHALLAAISKARPDFNPLLLDNTRRQAEDVPLDFLVRLLETNASTPYNLHFVTIINLIFLQLQSIIDPNRQGLNLVVVQCTPPSSQNAPVRSLRQAMKTTTYQQFQPSGEHFFMGAESLSGYSVSMCQAGVVQHVHEEQHIPVLRLPGEESAAAYPILRGGNVAGCLLVVSPQADFFLPRLQYILQTYAYLLSLAFETQQFYPPERIRLHTMPEFALQHRHLITFQERVLHLLRQDATLSRPQAEIIAWQQLEELLIHLPQNKSS